MKNVKYILVGFIVGVILTSLCSYFLIEKHTNVMFEYLGVHEAKRDIYCGTPKYYFGAEGIDLNPATEMMINKLEQYKIHPRPIGHYHHYFQNHFFDSYNSEVKKFLEKSQGKDVINEIKEIVYKVD